MDIKVDNIEAKNIIISKWIFSKQYKNSKNIPLYKSGNKHHFTNYRPVSLLCQKRPQNRGTIYGWVIHILEKDS